MLRERADAMNVRKRADEERLKMAGYYKASVIKELLPVIDNFERALKAIPKELEGNEYVKGIESIVKQFAQTLTKLGVERIKTVGEHFNPELHEAITMEEGEGEHEVVSEELQSGYKLGDEVIRHAMVRVKNS
jgi:molecular chaperone GrpE